MHSAICRHYLATLVSYAPFPGRNETHYYRTTIFDDDRQQTAGLGSNLYRLGAADVVIQRILRHANVGNTTTYYIKMAAGDVQSAMTKLEENIPSANPTSEIVRDTYRTQTRFHRRAGDGQLRRK